MSVDLEALEKFYLLRSEGYALDIANLIAEIRALRTERDALNESADALSDRWDGLVAERDKWMADHARQYSIAAAYAVERDALRARVANLMERVKSWHTRSLERLECLNPQFGLDDEGREIEDHPCECCARAVRG